MKDSDKMDLSWDDWDELNDPRPVENDFDDVVERAISRRGFLGGVLAFGSGAAVMGTAGLMSSTSAQAASSRFGFTPVPISTDSTVHVPEGYEWQTIARWGDKLFSSAGDFDPVKGVDLASSDKVFGENTDGMELYNVEGHQLIAVNHEYVNPKINLSETEGEVTSADQAKILQNMQGVTVMEVAEQDGNWSIVVDSPYNRRIHHNTPMKLQGPAAGSDLLKTAADPSGTESLGTFNNCGAGRTPWGTYLTCEENFNGYFGSTDENFDRPADYKRYGINLESRYSYEKFDARFDVSQNPNEPYRAGYIVEIDPSDASSTPIKRTALGRFKHENAAVAIAADGRPVVYMGDDERGEYMYKFVASGFYAPGVDTSTLLDDGQLYVARYNDDGTGTWLALTPSATGMSEEEIAVFSRVAGTAVGATTMDRPEWVAVNPNAVEVYCCLTNNSRRGAKNDDGSIRTNAAGEPMIANAPNPRDLNKYGQIVRLRPHNDDHATSTFDWDLYVMAGNPTVHSDAYAGSSNINEGNMFNSPDGMMFDSAGLLWIQTDGNDSNEDDYAGMGNNQMLAGDPVTGQIERFMTVPQGAEVTGLTWSSDRRSMFVGIQHPDAPFPDGEGVLARSSVVVVKRGDNGLVG